MQNASGSSDGRIQYIKSLKVYASLTAMVTSICLAASLHAAELVPPEKLIPVGERAGMGFGFSVDIDGDSAIIGAPIDGQAGAGAGSAFIFTRAGDGWTRQAKLLASDAAPVAFFGYRVAIHGDTVVVGADGDDAGGAFAGAAYVFVRSGSEWTQQAKLVAGDAETLDHFGVAVAIGEDVIVVGADGEDSEGSDAGAAYVFVRSGTAWFQQTKLMAADTTAKAHFGRTVAIDGDTILVGADEEGEGGSKTGAVYVFENSGASWVRRAKLTASDAAAGDQFGYTIALSGDQALICSMFDRSHGSDSGSVYIFRRTGNDWLEETELTAEEPGPRGSFGGALSLSGDIALIATKYGAAEVFMRTSGAWTRRRALTADDAGADEFFGTFVSVSGGTAMVGALGDDEGAPDRGAVYVYEFEEVIFQPDVTYGASIEGETRQIVRRGDDCTTVTAIAPEGYSFVRWLRNGAEYSRENPISVTNITEDTNMAAEFGNGRWRVYFGTDGTFDATVEGETSQEVDNEGNCTTVTAVPPEGYVFLHWARFGEEYTSENPLTVTHVTEPMMFIAKFSVRSGLKWVDFMTEGMRLGTEADPFAKLRDGLKAITPGGTIRIMPGTSSEQLRIAQPVRLEATGALVRIGVIETAGSSRARSPEGNLLPRSPEQPAPAQAGRSNAENWSLYQ